MSKSPREPSELIVDGICRRFEDALKNAPSAKQRPRVEEFLSEAPELLRARLLLDLVGLEVDYRRGQNEAPLAYEYRERFPRIDRAWLDRLLPAEATIGGDAPQPNANAQGDDLSATRPFLAGESTSQGTRFRILRPHAKGGLGQVSVALDSELNREVALKEIQSRYADNPESRARFILEAEITGSLEHPGIVPVYGLGTDADGRGRDKPLLDGRSHSRWGR